MAASGGKQYGLILPQKKSASKPASLARPSIFGDDSDEESSVGETLQKEAIKKKMMKQTRLEMQKALEEDSTVYDYDNVYDDLQKQKFESNKKLLGGTDKKPKYINQLMRAVEERKKEQERRDERKIQKEREAEGEKFADKEAYVTSAYRQKLKEREEELEKERRQAEIEAALDVKKQKDLSGFYRHLLNQTVGEESIPDRSVERAEKSKDEKSPFMTSHQHANDSDEEPQSDDDKRIPKPEFGKPGGNSSHSKRHYRQRSPSSGSGDEREKERKQEKVKKAHKDKERDRTRDREREERHGHQKEDRDHRGERERHWERAEERGRERREREEERGRERRDRDDERGRERRDREDERGRERRDKERDKEKEDRDGKRNRAEGSPKDRDLDRNAERGKDKQERDKTDDKKKIRDAEGEKTQGKNEEKDAQAENGSQNEGAHVPSKFAKRNSDQTVSSARERYLARQMARSSAKPYIEKEED
ncbi:nuclear speckle splicing regulatory protein 1 [Hoplias malabaricus]|uniref:nuclear speckle splicing regulatory protein 1 n=1 Tax=Hoplias malabaricus TaxID=27720 RepID=UPI0034637B30